MPKKMIVPRRAKIVCTLGPSSESYEKISSMVRAGMDVARLNFSHGTHENHKKVIDIIRKVSKEQNNRSPFCKIFRVQKFEYKNLKMDL